jgi:hypothetical protein
MIVVLSCFCVRFVTVYLLLFNFPYYLTLSHSITTLHYHSYKPPFITQPIPELTIRYQLFALSERRGVDSEASQSSIHVLCPFAFWLVIIVTRTFLQHTISSEIARIQSKSVASVTHHGLSAKIPPTDRST